jgi:hypothetical protein
MTQIRSSKYAEFFLGVILNMQVYFTNILYIFFEINEVLKKRPITRESGNKICDHERLKMLVCDGGQ